MIDVVFRVVCIIIYANIQHIETNNTDRVSVIIFHSAALRDLDLASFANVAAGCEVSGLLESVSSAGVSFCLLAYPLS